MLNQFSRTQLLIGKEAMDRLSKTRVAIFGIGGVGGYTAEALARSGVGELDLIDDDKVCLTNINRQIFATRKTVGKYKVDVAEERLKDINPDIIINKHRTFYTPETSEKFDFSKPTKPRRLSSVQWEQVTSLILQRLRLPTFTKPRSVLLQGL